ncbi:MAG: hypothetical protein ACYSW3_02150 [Planctomycetota bacterium]|jgi:hypothetical protein
MAIYGAVGYRANMLRIENGKLVITSPSMTNYEWPAEPVAWSECPNGLCPKDEDGHIISAENCSCGIYSAFYIETVSYYVHGANYVPVLIEALGHYWFHWDEDKYGKQDKYRKGLTSSGVQVIAVVKDFRPKHRKEFYPEMWIRALSSFYNVPLITLEQADELVEWAWERFIPREKDDATRRYIKYDSQHSN